ERFPLSPPPARRNAGADGCRCGGGFLGHRGLPGIPGARGTPGGSRLRRRQRRPAAGGAARGQRRGHGGVAAGRPDRSCPGPSGTGSGGQGPPLGTPRIHRPACGRDPDERSLVESLGAVPLGAPRARPAASVPAPRPAARLGRESRRPRCL
ncbi:MAG: hypothetical protein AVDCRST_MAG83-2705, partial [uncultured Arthrobacter sp.]